MEIRELLWEGHSKRVFATERENLVWLEFKDVYSDKAGSHAIVVPGKGEINAGISSFLFQYLENYHVPTHFLERPFGNGLLVRKLSMIPIEVTVRNVATMKFAQRFHLPEGLPLEFPVMELFLKAPALGNPPINETHAVALGYARTEDVRTMQRMASKANAILKSLFDRRGLTLVEFTLEFGLGDNQLFIGDEISADTCRIWDKKRTRKPEKERWPQDAAGLAKVYREIFDRLTCAV